jgi:hypothetical protein
MCLKSFSGYYFIYYGGFLEESIFLKELCLYALDAMDFDLDRVSKVVMFYSNRLDMDITSLSFSL